MRAAALALVVMCGCNSILGIDVFATKDGGGGGGDDGNVPMDARADAGPDSNFAGCYGRGAVVVCPATPFSMAYNQTQPLNIDTGLSLACLPLRAPSTVDACLLGGTTVDISKGITATGTRPLVIASAGILKIESQIDVSSRRGGPVGAAGNDPSCTTATITQFTGGPGGSGATKGGDGGRGQDSISGAAMAARTAGTFRGGCPGGTPPNGGGTGGAGGGAVALIALDAIEVNAGVDASGAGGGFSTQNALGGGGGGAGGTIVFDAPMVNTAAVNVYAFGGGGGEGTGGIQGSPGSDPSSSGGAAQGGNGSSTGGDGGNGGTDFSAAGNGGDGMAAAGGGGGGGGDGQIIKITI